jgi:hypothetical protein
MKVCGDYCQEMVRNQEAAGACFRNRRCAPYLSVQLKSLFLRLPGPGGFGLPLILVRRRL